MILSKKGQSTIELAVIAIVVMAGIIVGGPYVLRSINSHFKLWDTAVQESNEDHLVQATKDQIGLTGGPCRITGWDRTPNCAINGCGPLERQYVAVTNPTGCAYQTRCVEDTSCCSEPVSLGQCWRDDSPVIMASDDAVTAANRSGPIPPFRNSGCTTSDLIYRIPCGNDVGKNLCREHTAADNDGPRDCRPACRYTEALENAAACNPGPAHNSAWDTLERDTPLVIPPLADQAACAGQDVCSQYCTADSHYNPADPSKCIRCGDGRCDVDENCQTCPCDCRTCPIVSPTLSVKNTNTPGCCSDHTPNGCIPGKPRSGPLGAKTFTVPYEGDYRFTAHVKANRQYHFFQAEPTLTGPGHLYTRLFNRHNIGRCNGSDPLKPDSTWENTCAGHTFYGWGSSEVSATSDTFHLTPGDYTITLEYDNRWGYECSAAYIEDFTVTVIAPPSPPPVTVCDVSTAPTVTPTNPTVDHICPDNIKDLNEQCDGGEDCSGDCTCPSTLVPDSTNGCKCATAGHVAVASTVDPFLKCVPRPETCPVFKISQYTSSWGDFIKTHSIWSAPESDSNLFLNQDITFSALVNIPADDTYTFKFSHDDQGSIYVDGEPTAVVNAAANNQTTVDTYTKYLIRGKHMVQIKIKNLNNPLGPQFDSFWRHNAGAAALTLEKSDGTILLDTANISAWLSNGNGAGTCVTTGNVPTDPVYTSWCQRDIGGEASRLSPAAPGFPDQPGCNHGNPDCAPNCGHHDAGTTLDYRGGTITCLNSPTELNDTDCKSCADLGQCSDGHGHCSPCSSCGDGICNNGETCTSCATDCGTCPITVTCPSSIDPELYKFTAQTFNIDGMGNCGSGFCAGSIFQSMTGEANWAAGQAICKRKGYNYVTGVTKRNTLGSGAEWQCSPFDTSACFAASAPSINVVMTSVTCKDNTGVTPPPSCCANSIFRTPQLYNNEYYYIVCDNNGGGVVAQCVDGNVTIAQNPVGVSFNPNDTNACFPAPAVCGDGKCEGLKGEACDICVPDCGVCSTGSGGGG